MLYHSSVCLVLFGVFRTVHVYILVFTKVLARIVFSVFSQVSELVGLRPASSKLREFAECQKHSHTKQVDVEVEVEAGERVPQIGDTLYITKVKTLQERNKCGTTPSVGSQLIRDSLCKSHGSSLSEAKDVGVLFLFLRSFSLKSFWHSGGSQAAWLALWPSRNKHQFGIWARRSPDEIAFRIW